MVTWTVAALLIIINGYLLLEFFSSEVHSILVGSIVCVAITLYVAFIVYLIMHGQGLSSQNLAAGFKRFVGSEN